MELKRSTLWTYGVLGLPIAMIGYPVGTFLPDLYAREAGVPLAVTGAMLSLARMSDAFTDPIIGFASDRWQTPFGRRKPWIVAGVPLLLASLWMLFHPPMDSGRFYLLFWYAAMTLGVTFLTIPYAAWGAELSSDYHERTSIQHSREVFVLVGLTSAAAVPFIVQDVVEAGNASSVVLTNLALVLMAVLPIVVVLLLSRVPEVAYRPARRRVRLGESLKLIRRNKLFLWVLAIELIVTLGESFRNALSLFFIRDYIGIPRVGRFYVVYFAVGLIAMPIWTRLARRFGKHRSLAFAMALVSVVSAAIFMLDRGQTNEFYVLFALKGFCFGAFAYLPRAMLADVVDIDSARSGDPRPGSYFAVHGIMNKGANALGPGLALPLLAFVDYAPTEGVAATSTASQLWWLGALYALVPTALFMVALYLAWLYPLTQARHARIERLLTRRRLREAA